MFYYIATFDNNGTEYFKTYEGNPTKVKNFAIRSAVIHLNIWEKAGTNIKEQRKHLTVFKAITAQEFEQATGL
jgi:hypothetical protein